MAGVLSRFSSATATTIQQLKNSSINENTVKSTAFWLSVWKKWCLEKEIAAKIENYEPTQFARAIRDREFSSSKQVLDGKAKQLRSAGRGKRPKKGRQLSEEEEEILWKSEKFGGKTPESLIHTMW